MPRLVHKLPKYSLHKPSGQAKVRFNGKTVYLGKFGSPESPQRYAELIAQIPRPEETAVYAEPAPGALLLSGEKIRSGRSPTTMWTRCCPTFLN